MATHRTSFFKLASVAPARKASEPLRLPSTVQNDVFLKALLETPTRKHTRRNPLEWAGAVALHVAIVAALIIAPLYTTGAIHLNEYNKVPLIAPPPPPAPPPPGTVHAAPHVAHSGARFTYTTQRLTAPKAIPKSVAVDNTDASAPELDGVRGGVPGGVPGGVIGGVVGGVLGGTGAVAPPARPQTTKTLVRAGSLLKAPRQTHNVDPAYPTLARQARIGGVVVVDAIIDEQGNVVQAHAVSGNSLLIAAALQAVLQWKYEPTSLNGRPVSVELQVQVQFNLKE